MYKDWSTLKKLIWLRGSGTSGGGATYETLTGKIVSFLTQRIAPLKIEADLEPIQDLHGYDAPWPPGGGKNKLPSSLSLLKERNTGGTWSDNVYSVNGLSLKVNDDLSITISGTATAQTYFTFVKNNSGIPFEAGSYVVHKTDDNNVGVSVVKNGSYWFEARTTDAVNTLEESANLSFYLYVKNSTSFSAPLTVYPMFESGSTASAYAPYSNECPISGNTGANVYVSNNNLFDPSPDVNSTFTSSIATAFSNYKSTGKYATGYTSNGEALGNNAQYMTTFTSAVSGTEYIIKNTTSGSNLAMVCFLDDSGNVISHNTGWSNQAYVHTALSNEKYIMISMKVAEKDAVIIALGDTLPEFVSHSGTSVTISFGQTVYGGTLTVNEDGTGSVKARPYYASYNGETLVGSWVSSMDAYAPGTTPTTGAQVVDMGGTETTIPLAPGQVNALQGQNVVWVDDSDEIKVTYQSN